MTACSSVNKAPLKLQNLNQFRVFLNYDALGLIICLLRFYYIDIISSRAGGSGWSLVVCVLFPLRFIQQHAKDIMAQANDLPLTMGEFLGAANFIIVSWQDRSQDKGRRAIMARMACQNCMCWQTLLSCLELPSLAKMFVPGLCFCLCVAGSPGPNYSGCLAFFAWLLHVTWMVKDILTSFDERLDLRAASDDQWWSVIISLPKFLPSACWNLGDWKGLELETVHWRCLWWKTCLFLLMHCC